LSAALQLSTDQQARFLAAVSPVRRRGSTTAVAAVSDGARHNLLLPVTSLVGREGATREVEHLLADTRLLTLTGIGGSARRASLCCQHPGNPAEAEFSAA
jgi:hypothetical protein